MKAFRWVLILVAVALAGAQFHRPSRANPPVDESRTIEARLQPPRDVSAVLARACRDCHSNRTRWRWYSEVAPVSWLVIGHVNHGRRHLNFSEWSSYDAKKAGDLLEEACEEIEKGDMPLPPYVFMHGEARLKPEEVRLVCEWARSARTELQRSALK